MKILKIALFFLIFVPWLVIFSALCWQYGQAGEWIASFGFGSFGAISCFVGIAGIAEL